VALLYHDVAYHIKKRTTSFLTLMTHMSPSGALGQADLEARPGRTRDYEIALRINDENDVPAVLLTEGSSMPEGWSLTQRTVLPTNEPYGSIFALAAQAAESVRSLTLDQSIHRERDMVVAEMLRLSNMRRQAAGLSVAGQTSYELLSGASFRQSIDSYWKPAFYKGNKYDHTATETLVHQIINGSWMPINVIIRCNHGDCPSSKDMQWYKRNWVCCRGGGGVLCRRARSRTDLAIVKLCSTQPQFLLHNSQNLLIT
jgi:hypothetical protein